MATEHPELAVIIARLDRLESRVRLWRAVGIGALALVGIGAAIARPVASAKSAPNVIEAQKFVVRDSGGVARAVIDTTGLTLRDADGIVRIELQEQRLTGKPLTLPVTSPEALADGDWLRMYDVAGQPAVELTEGLPPADFLQGDTRTNSTANLVLLNYDDGRASAANLGSGSRATGLWLTDTKLQGGKSWPTSNDTDAAFFVDGRSAGVTVKQRDSPRAAFGTLGGLPSLDLTDSKGYSAIVGVTRLDYPYTGKTESTAAASIVLFDNKRHPIWRAPNP